MKILSINEFWLLKITIYITTGLVDTKYFVSFIFSFDFSLPSVVILIKEEDEKENINDQLT